MGNVEVRLKVSKSSYEEKIAKLQDYLNELDRTVQSYQRKETELDTFIENGTDQYEQIRQNVEQNIRAVQKAQEMCNASIRMLQDTLREMEDFGENVAKTVQAAGEAAASGIKAGFNVATTLG